MAQLHTHPVFQQPISYAQFAKDGVWEGAWQFTHNQTPNEAQLQQYVGESQEVAFEILCEQAFFGLRFKGTNEEVFADARSCVQAFAQSKKSADFLTHLAQLLGVPAWGQEITFAEIGAINFWKSVGPYRIADWQQAPEQMDQLMATLQDQPVGRDLKHPKALELGCSGRYPHWFGIPISISSQDLRISADHLSETLRWAR